MTAIECYNQSLAAAKLQALEVLLKRALSDDPRESRLAAAQILRAAPLKSPPQRHPGSAQPEAAPPPPRSRQPDPTPPSVASSRPVTTPAPKPLRAPSPRLQESTGFLPPFQEPRSPSLLPALAPGPAGRLYAVAGSCSPIPRAAARFLPPPGRDGP